MDIIKIILGLCIIVVSFIYLIKNASQSMMDGLLKKKNVQHKEDETEHKPS